MGRARFLVLAIILILSALAVSAREGEMTLLSVSDMNGTLVGSTAKLYVDVEPGNGRVFIDTFPLSNMDTQISTRYAKEIA